uniref:Uncharacterized protein n=1 Tax=Molossus molossus TaxID=27622 RepID=A0A7J8C8Q0_MOLMO|nr:hypothetical protein HJG59_009881 [Molossus molossus]
MALTEEGARSNERASIKVHLPLTLPGYLVTAALLSHPLKFWRARDSALSLTPQANRSAGPVALPSDQIWLLFTLCHRCLLSGLLAPVLTTCTVFSTQHPEGSCENPSQTTSQPCSEPSMVLDSE